MQQLWRDRSPDTGNTRTAEGGYREFFILGRRFLYQPDDMRLFSLAADAPLPPALPVRVPQFELPQVRTQLVVLLPTLACNLRCRYCFEAPTESEPQPAETGTGLMPETVLRRAVELLPAGETGGIGFFGGEPLLAWALVRQGVEYARRRLKSCTFSLTTNGTLLTPQIARYLDAESFSLIVSLDGPAHLHDPARPLADGSGSYERVLHGLRLLSAYPQLAARTTLRGTFDGRGRHACLLERVRHLNELCRAYGLRNVSVEPAELAEGCARGGQPVSPSEFLYEEYLDVARWLEQERRAGRPAYFHHFDVRQQRLRNRRGAPSECGAGVGYCAVTPEGTIHACHRLGCPVGEVRGGIDLRAQQPWRDNRYYAQKGCADCWLRNVCGGGCRVTSLRNCGDMGQPDALGCWLTEVCVKCAAWLLSCENTAMIQK